jgi:hypothetical protein
VAHVGRAGSRTPTSVEEEVVDDDLELMSREELVAEVLALRGGIRQHRDSTGHELCWHHPALWGLLPERSDPLPEVPEWPVFLRGCVAYRQSLDEQLSDASRTRQEHPT